MLADANYCTLCRDSGTVQKYRVSQIEMLKTHLLNQASFQYFLKPFLTQ